MNRRSFLQTLAAIAAGTAIPVKALAEIIPRMPALELASFLKTAFKCSLGIQWAYVEPRPLWALNAIMVDDNDERWHALTPYVTIEVEGTEGNQADVLRAEFDRLLTVYPQIRGTPLYWRYPELIKLSERWYQDKGACVLTQEQYEDPSQLSAASRHWITKNGLTESYQNLYWPTDAQAVEMSPALRAELERIVDDRDDEVTPEGCLGCIADGGIYMPAGPPWRIRKLRTRLAIPALQKLAGVDLCDAIQLPMTYEASGRLRIHRDGL